MVNKGLAITGDSHIGICLQFQKKRGDGQDYRMPNCCEKANTITDRYNYLVTAKGNMYQMATFSYSSVAVNIGRA